MEDVAAMLSAVSAAALLVVLPVLVEEFCLVLRSLGFWEQLEGGEDRSDDSLQGNKALELRRAIADGGSKLAVSEGTGTMYFRIVLGVQAPWVQIGDRAAGGAGYGEQSFCCYVLVLSARF